MPLQGIRLEEAVGAQAVLQLIEVHEVGVELGAVHAGELRVNIDCSNQLDNGCQFLRFGNLFDKIDLQFS